MKNKFRNTILATLLILLAPIAQAVEQFDDNVMRFGDDNSTIDKTTQYGTLGRLRWNGTTGKMQLSENGGGVFNDIATGMGGGGGGATGVETAEANCEVRRSVVGGLAVDDPDEGACETFTEFIEVTGVLLEDLASSTTPAVIAWGPLFADASNPDSLFEAGFAAVNDASVIDTIAVTKLSTSSTSWNKAGGTNTSSCIQHSLTEQISVAGNRTLLIWFNLPTITSFSTFAFRASSGSDDTGTNFSEWQESTDIDGNAAVTGFQLIKIDLDRTPDITGGTSWAPTDVLKTYAICTNWTVAGAVATDIHFDGLTFMRDSGVPVPEYERLMPEGHRFTVHSSTTFDKAQIAVASDANHGTVNLLAGLANSYTAGTGSILSAHTIKHDDGFGIFNPDLTSGTIDLTQSTIKGKTLNASVTDGSYSASASFVTELEFEIKEILSGTQFKVDSSVNYTAQMPITTVMHRCLSTYSNGVPQYQCATATDITLTSGATFSADEITFAVTDTTGFNVGDLVWVSNLIDADMSIVPKGADHSYTSVALNSISASEAGLPYPGASQVFGHWLGSFTGSQADQLKNRQGPAPDLTLNSSGADGFTLPFLNQQFAVGPFTFPNSLDIPNTSSEPINGDTSQVTPISGSFWVIPLDITPTNSEHYITKTNNAGAGWSVAMSTATGVIFFATNGTPRISHGTLLNEFVPNHIAFTYDDSAGTASLWVNGVEETVSSITMVSSSAQNFFIGNYDSGGGTVDADQSHIADVVMWSGFALNSDLVSLIRQNGSHINLGHRAKFKYRWQFGPFTGQEIAAEAAITRITNVVFPTITKFLWQRVE